MGICKEITVNNIKMKYGIMGHGKKNFIILPGIYLKSVAEQIDNLEVQFKRFFDDYTIYVFDRRLNSNSGYTMKQMSLDTLEVIKAS